MKKVTSLNGIDPVGVIKTLAEAPDLHLDYQGSLLCANFDPESEDPIYFIRNLADLCARYAWASQFTMTLLGLILEEAPSESGEDAESRRLKLLEKYEPESV